jgi:hypothetical protein
LDLISGCDVWGSRRFRTEFLHDVPTPGTGPYFDASVPDNVTALVAQVAYLNCRVKNLGNRTVSWVRHRDIHLLTVGRYTYTSDQRFEALHSPHTEDWQLRVKYPQRKDTGVYECQISTTPPIGHFVHLHVVGNSIKIFTKFSFFWVFWKCLNRDISASSGWKFKN